MNYDASLALHLIFPESLPDAGIAWLPPRSWQMLGSDGDAMTVGCPMGAGLARWLASSNFLERSIE